jgi:hypothetical protein
MIKTGNLILSTIIRSKGSTDMLLSRSSLARIVFLVPVLFSLILGISSCATKVAAFSPLTVLSIVGGNVLIEKPGTTNWSNGKEGITLETGDKIKTDVGATATITFFDGSTIQLNSSTEISLDELLSKSSTLPKTIKIGQTIGETSSSIVKLVDPASRYEVDTQAGVAAVGGSKMVVTVATDGTTGVYNVEGIISFTAQGQEAMIPVGSVSTATPGQVPSTPQLGTPPDISGPGVTSISSQTGWQQTGLYLNAGDKFYVYYNGGSWSVDYNNFPYVGPAGYSTDVDKTIAPGYKFDASVPYGYLLGEVGTGKEILIGNKGGPNTADVSGFLSLRINDSDATLGDNDGAITANLRGPANNALEVTESLRQNPPIADVPAASEAIGGYATIQADGAVNVSLSAGSPSTVYGVYAETYNGTTGGAGNYQSWDAIGSLTTDTNGIGTFSGSISLSPGTHYLQIVVSIGGGWGPSAFGTNIATIIIK